MRCMVAAFCQTAFALPPARRLLQMGVYNCQLYNNLGLCCFYAQQYDMTLSSFERALALVGNDEEQADVWYNIGHVAVVSVGRMARSFTGSNTEHGNYCSRTQLAKTQTVQKLVHLAPCLQSAASVSC